MSSLFTDISLDKREEDMLQSILERNGYILRSFSGEAVYTEEWERLRLCGGWRGIWRRAVFGIQGHDIAQKTGGIKFGRI